MINDEIYYPFIAYRRIGSGGQDTISGDIAAGDEFFYPVHDILISL